MAVSTHYHRIFIESGGDANQTYTLYNNSNTPATVIGDDITYASLKSSTGYRFAIDYDNFAQVKLKSKHPDCVSNGGATATVNSSFPVQLYVIERIGQSQPCTAPTSGGFTVYVQNKAQQDSLMDLPNSNPSIQGMILYADSNLTVPYYSPDFEDKYTTNPAPNQTMLSSNGRKRYFTIYQGGNIAQVYNCWTS